jgi:hypothetical protein
MLYRERYYCFRKTGEINSFQTVFALIDKESPIPSRSKSNISRAGSAQRVSGSIRTNTKNPARLRYGVLWCNHKCLSCFDDSGAYISIPTPKVAPIVAEY